MRISDWSSDVCSSDLGSFSREEAFHDGETVRLRLINTSLARIMRLDFSRYDPIVIAVDGQPCDPFVPVDGRVVLGPAMRIDLILTMSGKPGNRYAVRDDFYPALSSDQLGRAPCRARV